MSAEDFLDTNIFVYLFDAADTGKRRLAESLVNASLERGNRLRQLPGRPGNLERVDRQVGDGARPGSLAAG